MIESMRAPQGDGAVRLLLRRIPCFAGLAPNLLHSIATLCRQIELPAGGMLCRQGDRADHLAILLEGQVALSGAAANGNRAVVEVLSPIAPILLSTVLAGLSYPINATSVAVSRVLLVEATGLHALMADAPELATALVRAQAMEFDAMVRQVCDLKVRTAAERLATYLLALAREHPAGHSHFHLPVRKRLLAAQLGCGQENLSRAFATLRDCGVETHGARVILHDIPRLRAFALAESTSRSETPW